MSLEIPNNDIYVPGHFQCPKCGFYLMQVNIHYTGQTSANTTLKEDCPNDKTEMIPVLWKDRCVQLEAMIKDFFEKGGFHDPK